MRLCKDNRMRQCCGMASTLALLVFLAAPPAIRAAGETVLPEGTLISLQLNDHLSTKGNNEGDAFTAVVIEPVTSGGRIVIPKGSSVNGSISRILRPGRFKGKAVMNLLFQSIQIPGHGQLPILATLVRVDPEGNAGVRYEGSVVGETSGGKEVGSIVTPGVAGSGIGAGIGRPMGLATVFSTRGKDLQVRRGATMEISLDKPLTVPQEGEAAAERN